MRKLSGPGSCEAWKFLLPLLRWRMERSCLQHTNPEVAPTQGLCPPPTLPGKLRADRSPRAHLVLLPGSPFLSLIGPWGSRAAAGAGPRGGQPEWGRGALEAWAALSLCSPLWLSRTPSRCPPRCRGETRVKYSQGRLSHPFPRVHTLLNRSGQLTPSVHPPVPRVLRSRTKSGFFSSQAFDAGLASFV